LCHVAWQERYSFYNTPAERLLPSESDLSTSGGERFWPKKIAPKPAMRNYSRARPFETCLHPGFFRNYGNATPKTTTNAIKSPPGGKQVLTFDGTTIILPRPSW